MGEDLKRANENFEKLWNSVKNKIMENISISFDVLKEMSIGEVVKLTDDMYKKGWESDDLLKEVLEDE